MPFVSVTSNVLKASVNTAAASAALVKAVSASLGLPEMFIMVPMHLGVPLMVGLSDAPAAYVHIRSIGRIDSDRNPETIAVVTKTVSEHLNVPATRVFVVLEDVQAVNWGAAGTTVRVPSK